MQKIIFISLLLLPLIGCIRERGETGMSLTQLSEVLSGGGGSAPARAPAPAQPAPGSQAPGTAASKMLQDPDDPYDSQIIDYVWGDSPEQAAQRCQQIAAQNGLRYVTVRRTSQKGKKWECHVDNL